MSGLCIRDIMTRNVMSVDASSNIESAAEIMAKSRVGSLVVRSDSGPIGMVTESDIIKKVVGQKTAFGTARVGDIMNTPLIFVGPDQKITDAASIMISNRIRRLPVVESGRIVGIVTHTDIVRASPAMISLLEERLKMREPEQNIPRREARVHVGSRAGLCEFCGQYSGDLSMFDENWCCESCATEKHEANPERRKRGFKEWSRMG
ncbi:MAG: CBS domain-containing protein [Candidatus Aenigmarchaeota archaeon]|nr:CBS domain-containing protein [Candidatus Aenigmarchaeota archaeon]